MGLFLPGRIPHEGPTQAAHARRSEAAFVQLAIDGATNSLVTVTFVERGRDFRGDAVQRMLVAQRLFGDHPHLLQMKVRARAGGTTRSAALQVHCPVGQQPHHTRQYVVRLLSQRICTDP